MKFKYHAYYPIVDFIKIDFGVDEMCDFIDKINTVVGYDESGQLFPDWTISFYFIYTKYSGILISKKGNAIKAEKNKEYNIIIPIPNDKEMSWGIKRSKFPYDITNNKNLNNEKNFIKLPVNYNDFSNMKDHVTSCAKEAIINLLINGLTIEGKKIKFSEKTIDEVLKL